MKYPALLKAAAENVKKKKQTRKEKEAQIVRRALKKKKKPKVSKTKKKKKVSHQDIVPIIPTLNTRKRRKVTHTTSFQAPDVLASSEQRGKMFSVSLDNNNNSSNNNNTSFDCNISTGSTSYMTSSDSSLVESIPSCSGIMGIMSPGDPRAIFEDSVSEDIQDVENTPALLCLKGRGIVKSSERSQLRSSLNLMLSPVPRLVLDSTAMITSIEEGVIFPMLQ